MLSVYLLAGIEKMMAAFFIYSIKNIYSDTFIKETSDFYVFLQ